jgi:hypothetical protein
MRKAELGKAAAERLGRRAPGLVVDPAGQLARKKPLGRPPTLVKIRTN